MMIDFDKAGGLVPAIAQDAETNQVLMLAWMNREAYEETLRTGRAWRAVREDPLASTMMTIPVNRVKLMAFSFGAVVAAMAGTVFAAQQVSVFPSDFDTPSTCICSSALPYSRSYSKACVR